MNDTKIENPAGERKIFTYPLFYKIVFRYGNFPATIVLLFYLVLLVINVDQYLINLLPIIISFLLLYFLNRGYLNLYKIMPFRIEADNEKIICTNFMFSKKREVEIRFEDIDSLTGGIYYGIRRGIMKVCDKKNNICIGYYNQIRNSRELSTIILSKVPRPVYDDVLRKTGFKK
jgi:hypothetical protein